MEFVVNVGVVFRSVLANDPMSSMQGLRRTMHASDSTRAEICGAGYQARQAWKRRFLFAKIRALGVKT